MESSKAEAPNFPQLNLKAQFGLVRHEHDTYTTKFTSLIKGKGSDQTSVALSQWSEELESRLLEHKKHECIDASVPRNDRHSDLNLVSGHVTYMFASASSKDREALPRYIPLLMISTYAWPAARSSTLRLFF